MTAHPAHLIWKDICELYAQLRKQEPRKGFLWYCSEESYHLICLTGDYRCTKRRKL